MCKQLSATICICFICIAGFSQSPPSVRIVPYQKKGFKIPYSSTPKVWKDTSDKKIQKMREELIRRRLAEAQGRYSHTTPAGKIYVLPPDNMPCLVPDSTLTIAIPNINPKHPETEPPMPNPLFKKKKQY